VLPARPALNLTVTSALNPKLPDDDMVNCAEDTPRFIETARFESAEGIYVLPYTTELSNAEAEDTFLPFTVMTEPLLFVSRRFTFLPLIAVSADDGTEEV